MSALDFDKLPRDRDGVIQGRYRVRVHEGLRDDLANRAVEGTELRRLHAAVGSRGMTIEPWEKPAPKPRRRRR